MGHIAARRQMLHDRLTRALTVDPLLTNTQLKERFNVGDSIIQSVRKKLDLPAPSMHYPTKNDLSKATAPGKSFMKPLIPIRKKKSKK